eukprot:281116-Prorocentrum_minimum.AAC.1
MDSTFDEVDLSNHHSFYSMYGFYGMPMMPAHPLDDVDLGLALETETESETDPGVSKFYGLQCFYGLDSDETDDYAFYGLPGDNHPPSAFYAFYGYPTVPENGYGEMLEFGASGSGTALMDIPWHGDQGMYGLGFYGMDGLDGLPNGFYGMYGMYGLDLGDEGSMSDRDLDRMHELVALYGFYGYAPDQRWTGQEANLGYFDALGRGGDSMGRGDYWSRGEEDDTMWCMAYEVEVSLSATEAAVLAAR